MQAQATMPSTLGRVARVLLVFLLVFGVSFHAELAIAATHTPDSLSDHEKGDLTNLTVYQLDAKDDAVIGGKVMSVTDTADGKDPANVSVAHDGSVKFVAVPKWKGVSNDGDPVAIADGYIEWYVNDEKDPASKKAVFTVDASTFGDSDSITVTCKLTEKGEGYVADSFAEKYPKKSFETTFKATLLPSPTATNLQLTLSGQGVDAVSNTLALTREKGKEYPDYQFTANVAADITAYDAAGKPTSEPFSYSGTGADLADASSGTLQNLEWQLLDSSKNTLDASMATIDPATGLLQVSQDCEFIVLCTMTNTVGVSSPAEVTVTCKTSGGSDSSSSSSSSSGSDEPDTKPEQEADQGNETLSQTDLHVVANVAADAVASGSAAGDAGSSSSSSAGESQTSSSSSAAVDEGSGSSASEASSSSSAAGDEPTTVKLDKTYSRSDVEGFESAENTYTMQASTSQITVVGEGPTLQTLFKELGITNLDAVYAVKFVDYSDTETTVNWSDLTAGSSDPLLAVKSYVYNGASVPSSTPANSSSSAAAGSESSSSAAAESSSSSSASSKDEASESGSSEPESSEPELLYNTCFRILYENGKSAGSASTDANLLRYVKEIVVNPVTEPEPQPEPEPEPDPEAPFKVSIDYAPAPIGYEAVFSPVPSKEIAGATFDFEWEVSTDGGTTWSQVSTNQTYTLKMTEGDVGHLIRVKLNSDMTDQATGKTYRATSDPVEIVRASGFGVQLLYDPPIAGDVALFRTSIIDVDKDVNVSKLEYIWELSTDNGSTWQRLADQYQGKPTLSIQTDPINENDTSKADASLTYIRVRVVETTGQKRVRFSNMQPLTVHVGDEAGDGKEKKNSGPPEAKPVTTVVDTTDPTVKKKNTTDEDDDLTFDDVSEFDDEGDGDQDASKPSSDGVSTTPSQLHVNDAVTKQVKQQEKAVQEYVESTVPGARWTALSTTEASGDDVRNILSDNPFAPFAIPMGLGITVAGGLEKILAFRRQVK